MCYYPASLLWESTAAKHWRCNVPTKKFQVRDRSFTTRLMWAIPIFEVGNFTFMSPTFWGHSWRAIVFPSGNLILSHTVNELINIIILWHQHWLYLAQPLLNCPIISPQCTYREKYIFTLPQFKPYILWRNGSSTAKSLLQSNLDWFFQIPLFKWEWGNCMKSTSDL